MDYKKINEQLKNLQHLRNRLTPIHTEEKEENTYEVYDIGLSDEFFIKLKIVESSYGDDDYIDGVEFVKGKKKEIITYEF